MAKAKAKLKKGDMVTFRHRGRTYVGQFLGIQRDGSSFADFDHAIGFPGINWDTMRLHIESFMVREKDISRIDSSVGYCKK